MTGEERRAGIITTIKESATPISGAALAKKYEVSRQVIVQDIALLRATHNEIYSTPKGYMLIEPHIESAQTVKVNNTETVTQTEIPESVKVCSRVYSVSHTDEEIENELNIFVDMGGRVKDVIIKHEIYGTIRADLPISCRRHVKEFVEGVKSGKSRPLKNLTSGTHFHTIEADNEETLELIEAELNKKGYLVKEN